MAPKQLRLVIALGTALAMATCLGCRAHDRSAAGAATSVDRILTRMTLDEKIALLHGAPEPAVTDQGEAGYLPGIARLRIPPLRFGDGPPGVLTRYASTALTATMGLAATFSIEDARANGLVIAREARSHGIDVVLQPYLNIQRDPAFERAYDTYGEDPLLTGSIGAALIQGIQGAGIMAQAKHFIGYDGAADISVDMRTLHEIYLAPFADAVAAGVASIMCGYDVINGRYACDNPQTLRSILRDDLHFEGFVTSDWGALHGTEFINAGVDLEMPGSGTVMDSFFEARLPGSRTPRAPLAGPIVNQIPEEPAPVASPAPTLRGSPPLGMLTALDEGRVSEARITQAAARILRQMERFGLLDGHAHVMQPSRADMQQRAEENTAIVRQTAEDAAVLLRNEAASLPLTDTDLASLAMIGPGALQTVAVGQAGEKALGRIERQLSPSAALRNLGAAHIKEAVADDMNGRTVPSPNLASDSGPGLERRDASGRLIGVDRELDFTVARGNALESGSRARWSGVLRIPQPGRYRLYLQVLGAGASLRIDGMRVIGTGLLQLHGNVHQPGEDNLLPSADGLDNLRTELFLAAGSHTLAIELEPEEAGQPVQLRLAWVTPEQRLADHRQAVAVARHAHTAVVFAWSRGRPAFQLPGDQDALIADVAAVNPHTIVVLNASEPVAMPWLDRVGAVLLMWYPGDEGGVATAEVLLGHAVPAGRLPFTWPRRLEQNLAHDPAHPERSSSGIDGRTTYSEGIFVGYRWFDQQQLEPLYPFGYGLSYGQFDYDGLSVGAAADGGLELEFQVHNAGAFAADEVPQVYLGAPSAPPPGIDFAPRSLTAFARVHLHSGETRRLQLHIAARALQYWSIAQRRWLTATGPRSVYVAASSRDPRLQAVTVIRAP
jgi:beta-glucosidase